MVTGQFELIALILILIFIMTLYLWYSLKEIKKYYKSKKRYNKKLKSKKLRHDKAKMKLRIKRNIKILRKKYEPERKCKNIIKEKLVIKNPFNK